MLQPDRPDLIKLDDKNIDSSPRLSHPCAMRVVTSVAMMQRLAKAWQRQGIAVGIDEDQMLLINKGTG
jgi:hypothetical protein